MPRHNGRSAPAGRGRRATGPNGAHDALSGFLSARVHSFVCSFSPFLFCCRTLSPSCGGPEKLATLSVQVGYPEQVLATSYLDDFYTAMSVQVNDFLGNILYGVHFLRKVEERVLLNPLPEHKWLAALAKDSISYIPESNRIVIPEHVLLAPFYSAGYPE